MLDCNTVLGRPDCISQDQLRKFALLVRHGFKTAEADLNLDARIRAAKRLALHYSTSHELVAIAALKSPSASYRQDVFNAAGINENSADYGVELGWVYVKPASRGKRLATTMCEKLLSHTEIDAVFATTRSDNMVMNHLLLVCGFNMVGKPYLHRNEQLRLYLCHG
jgi:predicted GNAT family acetyltransferase